MAILIFFFIFAVLNFATEYDVRDSKYTIHQNYEAKVQWKELKWPLSVGQIVGIAV
ncbi:MAG: hypothetical protein EZS28_041342, partial [Streblomastix strix]